MTAFIFSVLSALFLVAFWAAVLSFVPIAFYLLVKNPSLARKQEMIGRGIYILNDETSLERGERQRVRVVAAIYGLCAAFLGIVAMANGIYFHRTGVNPFEILSTCSVILFWLSAVTYVPVLLYVALRSPESFQPGICLTRFFIGYGLGTLIFCGIFIGNWMKRQHIPFSLTDSVLSFFIIVIGAMALAYLPILLYILFLKVFYPLRLVRTHPNVLFVIYSICFLVFSGVYVYGWLSAWQGGHAVSIWGR